MAAISGIICLKKSDCISEDQINITEKISRSFKTDRYEKFVNGSIFLACAHQFFTHESVNDISPIYNEKTGLYMTGDIFLFNREELIKKLCSANANNSSEFSGIGDVMLVYKLFCKFGTSSFSMLKGCYSFAIYDYSTYSLYLVTDRLGQRHLAYTVLNNKIYFSTALHIISAWLGKDKRIDEEWMSAAFLDFSPETERLPGKCFLENVYRVEPGTYLTINTQNTATIKTKYWDPIHNIKTLDKKYTEADYKKLFRETFEHAVKSCLRARKNYGIMLSGGLDSSSIVSVAAKELAKKSEKIFSYTQIPMDEYKCNSSPYIIENETEEVLHNKELYPNIECKFITFNGKTCISELDKISKIYLQPVKPILNMPYILAMSKAAQEDQCSILFNGQGGNATISYGNIYTYIYHKLKHLHIIKAYKGIKDYCSLYNASMNRVLRLFFRLLRERKKNIKHPDYGYLKDFLIRKYNLKLIDKKIAVERGNGLIDSQQRRYNFIYMPLTFQHFGYYDTCRSLFYGFLPLDPTLSSDIIELCLAMPIDCFFHNGKERRAVRDYMSGIVSDSILNNLKKRGRQGADYVYRFNKFIDSEYALLVKYLNNPLLYHYLDKEKIQKLIEIIKENKYNLDSKTIVYACVSSSLSHFLLSQNTSIGGE